MEIQFEKIPIKYLKKLTGQLRTQEQTLEVRLTDGMPDIGRVLGAWGQVIVRGKEWNSDNMAVSCGVMAWVLYMPEDGEGVRSVEAWLPFSMKWDLPETQHDGKIMVSCLLRSVDARSISARKLMVRATVSTMGDAWLQEQTLAAVPTDVPEDVQLLTESYPCLLPKESGEKAFLLEEQLEPATNGEKPKKILYYSLRPEIVDKKVMAGKVVFRGTGLLHLLYLCEDGTIHSWDHELPFSQYADLDGEYEQDANISIYPCVTSLDLTMEENGQLQLKAGILGQYLLHDRAIIPVTEDAYSNVRSLQTRQEQLQLPCVLDQLSQLIHGEQTARADARQILDVTFYPSFGQTEQTDSGVKLSMPGQFQLLYVDENGELRSQMMPWEGEWSINTAEDSLVDWHLLPMGKPQGSPGMDTVDLRAEMVVEAVVSSGRGIPMITALEIGGAEKPDPNRPSLILCRKGNGRLWDVAKASGSTVKAIMDANHLESEPEDDRVLLIPVS